MAERTGKVGVGLTLFFHGNNLRQNRGNQQLPAPSLGGRLLCRTDHLGLSKRQSGNNFLKKRKAFRCDNHALLCLFLIGTGSGWSSEAVSQQQSSVSQYSHRQTFSVTNCTVLHSRGQSCQLVQLGETVVFLCGKRF